MQNPYAQILKTAVKSRLSYLRLWNAMVILTKSWIGWQKHLTQITPTYSMKSAQKTATMILYIKDIFEKVWKIGNRLEGAHCVPNYQYFEIIFKIMKHHNENQSTKMEAGNDQKNIVQKSDTNRSKITWEKAQIVD